MDALHDMPQAYCKAFPFLTPNYLTRSDCGKGGDVCIFILEGFSICVMHKWVFWEKRRGKNHLICSCNIWG